jgi:uncharacterized RDD family membrane protein YckC
MYCKHCGKSIEEKSIYCIHCGVKQNNEVSINLIDFSKVTSLIKKHKIFLFTYFIFIIIGILYYNYKLDIDNSFRSNKSNFEKTFFKIAIIIFPIIIYSLTKNQIIKQIIAKYNLRVYYSNLEMQLKRVEAFLIDMLILYVISFSIINLEIWGRSYNTYWNGLEYTSLKYILQNLSIPYIAYIFLVTFITNGKIGNKIIGIKVVNNIDNESLSIDNKIIRTLIYILELISLGTLTIISFFNKDGRTLSDILSKSKVIKKIRE